MTDDASARGRLTSAVATGKGDDGTTGLLFGGARVSKDDARVDAYGTIDEAVAALGLARAQLVDPAPVRDRSMRASAASSDLILRFQRELFVAASELATNPDAWDRLVDGQTRVSAEMVEGVEAVLRETESRIVMPREFVVPGETTTSAALELARTVLRRAERRIVALEREGLVPGEHLLPYVNRLADLLWVLARAAEQAEARVATPSRIGGRARQGTPTAPVSGSGAVQMRSEAR